MILKGGVFEEAFIQFVARQSLHLVNDSRLRYAVSKEHIVKYDFPF